jgi:hypothetical protein
MGYTLSYFTVIYLDGLRKATKSQVRIAGLLVRDLHPVPPEYEAEML